MARSSPRLRSDAQPSLFVVATHLPSGEIAKSIVCPPGEPGISRIEEGSGIGSSPTR